MSKYLKNVVPDWTQYFKDRLENIKAEELIITIDMVQDAHRQYERMVEERDVKHYINRYMKLMWSLLVFHKPFEESCSICEGELFYYTDLIDSKVIKGCMTCGTYFDPLADEAVVYTETQARPATKLELLYKGIID